MTFLELQEEFYARGFNDFEATTEGKTRAKRLINQAYCEITDIEPWPFLEKTQEGTAPLTITDLRRVLSFINKSNENNVWPATRQEIVRRDPDQITTGTGYIWFRENETTFKVWPEDTTSTFQVRYVKIPVELSADSDEPVIPKPYQNMIVDGAVIRAYRIRDNFEASNVLREEWKEEVVRMQEALRNPADDANLKIIRSGLGIDYI